MTIDLSEITFENDFFSIDVFDENTLTLNKIDESLSSDSEAAEINRINIQLTTADSVVSLPSVIGIDNSYMKINTDYKEYEGKVLTSDNMKYCTIEIYE